MLSSNQPSKTIFNLSEFFKFFSIKKLSQKWEKGFFFRKTKKVIQNQLKSKPLFLNLLRMVLVTEAVKSTQFEEIRKNSFFSTLKKWKIVKNSLQTNRMKKWSVKASMPCQMRIACQFLKQSIGFFLRTKPFFDNFSSNIYTN